MCMSYDHLLQFQIADDTQIAKLEGYLDVVVVSFAQFIS